MKNFTYYTLGFVFNPERTHVMLIRKTRPQWQAGLLNGIGGKLEEDESDSECMIREFKEETGLLETPSWKAVGERRRLSDANGGHLYRMRIFAGELPLEVMQTASSANDEKIEVVALDYNSIGDEGVPGLVWTINIALCALQEDFSITVEDM